MKAALLRLHIAVVLWGFTGPLGKLIGINAVWLVWWRMCITAISLWAIFFIKGKRYKVKWKDFLPIAANGTLQGVHWILFFASIEYSNVSIALTCLATTALFAAIIEPLVLQQKIKLPEVMLGLMALCGIAIIYITNLNFSIGIYLGLLSSVAIVFVSVFNKKMIDKYEPQSITMFQLSGGFLGLCILLPLYSYFFHASFVMPRGIQWLWFIILSWACTILTFSFYLVALKKVSAFTINLALTLEPVYGIALAFILFDESKDLSNYFYAGFILILLAVILQTMRIVKHSKSLEPI